MKKYEQLKDNKLGLRDHLAMDRTAMANERTFLAFARTAIMVMVTSVTLFKLFPDSRLVWIAAGLLPVALVTALAGVRRYMALGRALRAMKR